MKRPNTYVNGEESALVNPNGQFVYEVFTFVQFENIYTIANVKLYYSDKPLNIVPNLKITPYIEVHCELYSAPYEWLINSGFTLYVKPEKKKRIKKNTDEQKSMSSEQ